MTAKQASKLPIAEQPELAALVGELNERWNKIRDLVGAKSDDTVQEVYDRCEQYRAFWDAHGGPI